MWHCQKRAKARTTFAFKSETRRGAALVEFAICLPVLVLIVLGSIEAASAVFVRQGLVVAAYEAAREAARRGSTADSATARAQAILTQRKINSSVIKIIPSNVEASQRGEPITIEITAGMQANSPFFGRIIQDRNVVVSTVMVRE
jgi:Flp pilus assembly protein TadG